ncbi:DUF3108 domain-containing protein [Roseivirga pacifica]|uniref:DUF3108 domain-containing protein n=1 Tax=Roseivirga pacifica TaxID=1267423 RepID=UPI00209549AB|nr:hypothetical protein [Roseivirga pacifica]MCO6359655.1 hypothetical protein [Roseivirga pacifica]MCO6367025.1 hypothetical protein [Roseivirga pacifica]MCO6370443.1 hypothetical protein [Roseivirga pacifica]MCO6374682.1 hypothetical protein [Roseivirga pacifica]MCO6379940.1 hypothetical protein [Roseivirga pacifica]
MQKLKISLVMLLIFTVNGQAQDTIRVGHRFKQFENLELGTVTDIVYNEYSGKLNGSLKTRTTEMIELNGKEYVKITHIWRSPNAQNSGRFEYYCEPYTLKPVQHIRYTDSKGKEAFHFTEQLISGLDSASENQQADFELVLTEPTYNWEIDLETYALIPMSKGKKVVMPFYHPGSPTKPDFYTLEVTGTESIKLANGKTMECWVIFTDYHGTQPTKFWYTKAGQNFVKMEGEYKGMKIYKTRLY